jgi:hypothetical protein
MIVVPSIPAAPQDQVDRILVNSAASLSFAPTDQDGEVVAVTATGPITISNSAGAEITGGTATLNDDGTLSYDLAAADLPLLDTYAVKWQGAVGGDVLAWQTTAQVVGGFHYSLAAFKALRPEFATMTPDRIRDARTLAEERFELECRVAFVPRGARETLKGPSWESFLLAHVACRDILAMKIDGTILTGDQIAAQTIEEGGILRLDRTYWTHRHRHCEVEILYSHGYDRPDRAVRDAVLRLAKDYAVPDANLPARALVQLTDYGAFRIGRIDDDNPFGIDSVDAVYRAVRRHRPPVG